MAITCSACRTESELSARFCKECGSDLHLAALPAAPLLDEGDDCRNCGSANSAGTKFCVRCGTSRVAIAPAAPAAPAAPIAIAPSLVDRMRGSLQPHFAATTFRSMARTLSRERRLQLNWAGGGLACIAAMAIGAIWFFNSPESRPMPSKQPVAARAMGAPVAPRVLAATVGDVRDEREPSVVVAPLRDSGVDVAALTAVKNLQATPVSVKPRMPAVKTAVPASTTPGPEPLKTEVSVVPASAATPVAVLAAPRPAPAPVVAVARLPSPRDACGEGVSVGTSMCMALRCRSAPFNSHAQCVESTRAQKEHDQQRQQRQEAGG